MSLDEYLYINLIKNHVDLHWSNLHLLVNKYLLSSYYVLGTLGYSNEQNKDPCSYDTDILVRFQCGHRK